MKKKTNLQKVEETYTKLQEEARFLAKKLAPLAKRFKRLAKDSLWLANKLDEDTSLYVEVPGKDDVKPDGWNFACLFRLQEFDLADVEDAQILCENLAKTDFLKRESKI